MPLIDQKYLQILRDAGLCISKPFGESHSLPSAVKVGKPISTVGNCIPNFELGFADTVVDAPLLYLFIEDDKWMVYLHDGVPTMVKGDFMNAWNSPEEAVQDILDYYFGNPERMKMKAEKLT